MKHASKFAILAALLLITSACAQHERPRTVSDFCLNTKRISAEPAPELGMDDPGNHFDTDQTLFEVLEHNAARDRLCPGAVAP